MRSVFAIVLGLGLALAGAPSIRAAGLAEQVERAALQAVQAHVVTPERFEVVTFRFGGGDPLPPGRLDLELLELDGPNASGVVRLRFLQRVDGTPRGEARASLRGRVHAPVLVTRRPLLRGEPIDLTRVALEEVDVTRIRHESPLGDLAQLQGRAPVRTLGAGRVLTEAVLQPEFVVRRGQPVDLRVVRRGFVLVASGTALADGAPGDQISASNDATGTRVLGTVQPDGALVVLRSER